jgi:hypothetical protein
MSEVPDGKIDVSRRRRGNQFGRVGKLVSCDFQARVALSDRLIDRRQKEDGKSKSDYQDDTRS